MKYARLASRVGAVVGGSAGGYIMGHRRARRQVVKAMQEAMTELVDRTDDVIEDLLEAAAGNFSAPALNGQAQGGVTLRRTLMLGPEDISLKGTVIQTLDPELEFTKHVFSVESHIPDTWERREGKFSTFVDYATVVRQVHEADQSWVEYIPAGEPETGAASEIDPIIPTVINPRNKMVHWARSYPLHIVACGMTFDDEVTEAPASTVTCGNCRGVIRKAKREGEWTSSTGS